MQTMRKKKERVGLSPPFLLLLTQTIIRGG